MYPVTYKWGGITQRIDARDVPALVDDCERQMMGLPQAECPVIHHFGPGICIREVHMSAGTVAIGHHQRFEHVNVFLKGRVRMLQDDGTTKELSAPMLFVGKPGRKVGLILEDVVWQNIYATEETDIEKIEAHFLDKSAAHSGRTPVSQSGDTDKADFLACLAEFGFAEDAVSRQSVDESDQIGFSGSVKVKVSASPLHGKGLFATADIHPGELIAMARIDGMRTPAGRYTNHSAMPNAEMRMAGDDVALYATRLIAGCKGGQNGEEVLTDYRATLAAQGIKRITS